MRMGWNGSKTKLDMHAHLLLEVAMLSYVMIFLGNLELPERKGRKSTPGERRCGDFDGLAVTCRESCVLCGASDL